MSRNPQWTSSIGAKTVMGLTGLALVAFLVIHMIGNLQVFLGSHHLNTYAAFLQGLPELLWGFRIGLVILFTLHAWAAIRVTLGNRAARPAKYHTQQTLNAGIGARTLFWTGSLVLAFLVYHVLHFTLGVTNPEHYGLHDAEGRHDVYTMVILGFSLWPVALAYIVANLLLGFHLSHAVPSLFQTLGLNDPRWEPRLRSAGIAVAIVVAAGNISMPLAILAGLLGPATGGGH